MPNLSFKVCNMKTINPHKVEELVSDLCSISNEHLHRFASDFPQYILSVSELIKSSYAQYKRFENQRASDLQFSSMTMHVYMLVESMYTSTKLLVLGFVTPSGNQFRVAIESMALAALLSWRAELIKKDGNNVVKADFWESYSNKEGWTKALTS